jgi:hypothetical protein
MGIWLKVSIALAHLPDVDYALCRWLGSWRFMVVLHFLLNRGRRTLHPIGFYWKLRTLPPPAELALIWLNSEEGVRNVSVTACSCPPAPARLNAVRTRE